MGLRYIVGRSGAGKTYGSFKEIVEQLKTKEEAPLLFLVPEQFTFQSEKDLIYHIKQDEELKSNGSIRAQVASFKKLAYRIFQQIGGSTRTIIGEIGKDMILRNVVDSMEQDILMFQNVAKQQGFIQNLAECITEFKRYEVTPEKLLYLAEEFVQEEGLKNKLLDLGQIYSQFEIFMAERFLNMDEYLTIAAKTVEESDFLEGAEIWVDGFYGFTPQQMHLLKQIARKAKRVNITVPMDPELFRKKLTETDLFYSSSQMVEQVDFMASGLGMKIEEPYFLKDPVPKRFKSQPELAHVEHEFFKYPYKPYGEETKGIRIFASVNRFSEVEEVAKEITRLVREEKYRYRDIMVTCRGLELYENLLERSFKEQGIPYFLDRKRSVIHHPLIRMIQCLIQIFTKNWSYEAVFGYLKTDLTGIPREEIDILENYVLAYGIRGKAWTEQEEWTYIKESMEGQELSSYALTLQEKVNEIRQKVLQSLSQFQISLGKKASHPVKDLTAVLITFLLSNKVPERLEGWAEEYKRKQEIELEKENSQIWDLVIEVFDQIVEIIGEDSISLEEYEKLLETGFARCELGLIPPALDQVLVGDIERSRSHEIKALFVIGVNDGVLPAPMEEKGLFSDGDRTQLFHKGMKLGPDSRKMVFEEQFLIYSAFTRPSQYLHLSYALADTEGKALRPSMLIGRMKKLFPKLQEHRDVLFHGTDQETLHQISRPKATFRHMVQALREYADTGKLSPMWAEVYGWYRGEESWKEITKNTVLGLFHTNLEETIQRNKIPRLYGSPMYSSVSKLETFAACPFSFFVKYGLLAKERKKFELRTPDVGRLFHKTLDNFSQHLEQNKISWREVREDQCKEIISEIMEEIVENMGSKILKSSPRYQYLLGRLKRITGRAVWALTEHVKRGLFEPTEFEIEFSDNADDLPPMVIEFENGEQIKLTGRIDRVDTLVVDGKRFIKIIDYKSGTKAFQLSEVFYGIQLQLLLYLDALLEHGDEMFDEKLLPAGMFYFKIDDPIISAESKEAVEKLEQAILKQLKMTGLVLADVNVVKAMDEQIGNYSDVLPAGIKKDGSFSNVSSVASLEEFTLLRKHGKKLVQELAEEITKGRISIDPLKQKKVTSCTYCDYGSICQFDTLLKNNEYKIIKPLKQEQVWKLLKEENEEGGDHE